MIPIPSRSHLAAFYRGSFYNSTDQTPQVQAFQLLRYHRNPSAHGLEHAYVLQGCKCWALGRLRFVFFD